MTDQKTLMKQLMSYRFATFELALFLDTHPNDKKALEMHKAFALKTKALTEEYEENYGPLTSSASLDTEYWRWIESPWPWEKEGN